jgi:Flp pilus assembly pilin Flp
MPPTTTPPHGTPPVQPVMTALLITAIAVVLIAGFAVIGAVLHIVPVYAGFLLLWYWTSVTHADLRALAPAVVGGLTGAGLSYLLQNGAATANVTLIVGALALMVVALFLVIAGRLPLFCNASTMLYVTVFNADVIQRHEDFRQVIIATVLGMIWFGLTIGLLGRLAPQPQTDQAVA